jgi:hypothetical protein
MDLWSVVAVLVAVGCVVLAWLLNAPADEVDWHSPPMDRWKRS